MARDDPERPARGGSVLRGAWAGLMATAPMTVVLLVAQRLRLLERPEIIRAVGEDTAAMAAERVRDVS